MYIESMRWALACIKLMGFPHFEKKIVLWFGATYKMSTIHGEASMSTRCQRNFVLKILLIKALLDFFKLFPRDFGDSIIYGSIP